MSHFSLLDAKSIQSKTDQRYGTAKTVKKYHHFFSKSSEFEIRPNMNGVVSLRLLQLSSPNPFIRINAFNSCLHITAADNISGNALPARTSFLYKLRVGDYSVSQMIDELNAIIRTGATPLDTSAEMQFSYNSSTNKITFTNNSATRTIYFPSKADDAAAFDLLGNNNAIGSVLPTLGMAQHAVETIEVRSTSAIAGSHGLTQGIRTSFSNLNVVSAVQPVLGDDVFTRPSSGAKDSTAVGESIATEANGVASFVFNNPVGDPSSNTTENIRHTEHVSYFGTGGYQGKRAMFLKVDGIQTYSLATVDENSFPDIFAVVPLDSLPGEITKEFHAPEKLDFTNNPITSLRKISFRLEDEDGDLIDLRGFSIFGLIEIELRDF